MDADSIKSPTARRILVHWADPRPAWLWSQDGSNLLWRNPAGRYFGAKVKKGALKLAPDAVPIKGQVARLLRLGVPGRSSLSRVQFLSGGRPVAATCSCTPVTLDGGQIALLLVDVDPLDNDVREAAGPLVADTLSKAILPRGWQFALLRNGAVVDGSMGPTTTIPADESLTRMPADAYGAELLIFPAGSPPATAIAEVRAEEGVASDDDDLDLAHMPEPMLPLGIDALPEPAAPIPPSTDEWVDPIPAGREHSLSSLFDRLADDAELYTSLTAADEVFHGPAAEDTPSLADSDQSETIVAPEAQEPVQVVDERGEPPELDAAPDLISTIIEFADDPETIESPSGSRSSQWLITGRGFRALGPPEPSPVAAEPEEPPQSRQAEALAEPEPGRTQPVATVDAAPDRETAERVSRYNFEELGRILSDRVAGEPNAASDRVPAAVSRPAERGVINLSAETLVLNRLPLAIMVFRDQQVLFANRALTDMLGHDSVETLREAGIASIFPTEEIEGAGPVSRLIRRDGVLLPVTARLQSVSWQGRAALMLSAMPAEAITTHESAVRAFAEIAADAREEGYVTTDRGGVVTRLSGHASVLVGRTQEELVGKPLAILVGRADLEPLRAFLEKPARFAETARPSLVVTTEDGAAELALFAEGQAGIVQGYFGFIRKKPGQAAPIESEDDPEPEMLGRLSRGIRRPLNTIIGFADLIRASAVGAGDATRAAEYARDIRTAGLEIAVLVDELEDFARLREGSYDANVAAVDLGGLLETCMLRLRTQASAARVLVRSAIAERLPAVRADRGSLEQALLNLLASAIDQTPIGGSVVLSAQQQEDGSVTVHVRDGAQRGVDIADRFVVFRDGVDKDGEMLQPVRSSVGLALTRSLLAVNACSLSIDPVAGAGTLFSLLIPADLVQAR